MRKAIFGLFVVSGVLAGVFAPLRAQSLAEVALKEEARRKGGKEAAKTYSNKDLPGGATTPSAAPDAAPAAGASADASADAAKGVAPDASKAPGAGTPPADAAAAVPPSGATQGQPYWSGRMSAARAQLARDEQFAEALQVQINSLTTDFSNRDDPAQRSQVAASRQKAVAELDRVKKAIQDDKKAIATVQEEGRVAGVPAGWLR